MSNQPHKNQNGNREFFNQIKVFSDVISDKTRIKIKNSCKTVTVSYFIRNSIRSAFRCSLDRFLMLLGETSNTSMVADLFYHQLNDGNYK